MAPLRRNAGRSVSACSFFVVVGVPVGGAGAHQPAADVRARMEQAIALLAAEQVDRAIPILLSVVDDVPYHGPARFQLGALAVERGEWAVAADHLGAAVDSYGPEAPDGAIAVQRPGLAWALYSEALWTRSAGWRTLWRRPAMRSALHPRISLPSWGGPTSRAASPLRTAPGR